MIRLFQERFDLKTEMGGHDGKKESGKKEDSKGQSEEKRYKEGERKEKGKEERKEIIGDIHKKTIVWGNLVPEAGRPFFLNERIRKTLMG